MISHMKENPLSICLCLLEILFYVARNHQMQKNFLRSGEELMGRGNSSLRFSKNWSKGMSCAHMTKNVYWSLWSDPLPTKKIEDIPLWTQCGSKLRKINVFKCVYLIINSHLWLRNLLALGYSRIHRFSSVIIIVFISRIFYNSPF